MKPLFVTVRKDGKATEPECVKIIPSTAYIIAGVDIIPFDREGITMDSSDGTRALVLSPEDAEAYRAIVDAQDTTIKHMMKLRQAELDYFASRARPVRREDVS